MDITLDIDGTPTSLTVEPRALLGQVLRDLSPQSQVRLDCETSTCGSCTVLLDGEPVKSCAVLAPMADGCSVTTASGLGSDGVAGAVVLSLSDPEVLPCGECRPAMQVVAAALLNASPRPTADQVSRALSGTVCRCTGYRPVVDTILAASGGSTS